MTAPADPKKNILRMLQAAYKLAKAKDDYAQMAEIAMRMHYVTQEPVSYSAASSTSGP